MEVSDELSQSRFKVVYIAVIFFDAYKMKEKVNFFCIISNWDFSSTRMSKNKILVCNDIYASRSLGDLGKFNIISDQLKVTALCENSQ